jgi:hypothetical protein
VYYDSPPKAPREVFGVVVEFIDAELHRVIIMLGTTLPHGCQSAADELMSLVQLLWLVRGFGRCGLEQALCETWSLASDCGTESIIGAMHNVLDVFAATVGQKVSGAFLSFGHIFPNAVIVIDWHHLVSAAVKTVLSSISTWPDT